IARPARARPVQLACRAPRRIAAPGRRLSATRSRRRGASAAARAVHRNAGLREIPQRRPSNTGLGTELPALHPTTRRRDAGVARQSDTARVQTLARRSGRIPSAREGLREAQGDRREDLALEYPGPSATRTG